MKKLTRKIRLSPPYPFPPFRSVLYVCVLLLSICLFSLQSAAAGPAAPITLSVSFTGTTCGNANGKIQVTATGGTPPYTYAVNSNPVQSFGTFTNLPAGPYTITVTDALSSVATTAVTLTNTFNGPTALTAQALRPSGCEGRDGSLTFSVTGGTPPYKYTVDRVNFQTSNHFANLTAGSYYAYAEDANGCRTPDNWQSYTNVPENCPMYQSGQNLSYNCDPFRSYLALLNVGGGTAPYTYSLDGLNYQASNSFFPAPEGLHTIWIKDATGLIALYSVGVVDRCPILFNVSTVTVDATCGVNGQITISASNGTAPYTYSINGAPFQSNNVFPALAPGSYTMRVMDANTQIMSKLVIVKNNCMTVSAFSAFATCGNNNGTITMTASNGLPPYSYSLDNINFTVQNHFTNVSPGQYTVVVRDAANNTSASSVVVGNIAGPQAGNITATAATCANNDGSLLLSAQGGTAPVQYSINGGAFKSSPSFGQLAGGQYTFVMKDANGCTATGSATVPLVNNLVIDAGNNKTICEGESLRLQVNTNAVNISWTPSATLDNAANPSPLATPAITTKYYVSASTGNCTIDDSVTVNVLPAPVADAGEDVQICYGADAMLAGSGGVTASWTPSTFLDDARSFQTAVTKPLHSTEYTLQVKDANGCASIQGDRITVHVTPPAEIFAGNDTSIAIGQKIDLAARDVNGAGFSQYRWSPATGLDNPFAQHTQASPQKNATYYVRGITAAGCEGTDTINIKVFLRSDIYVPNAFTPNGDGRNDVLYVVPVGIKQFHYFILYDRWGNIVFRTANPSEGWNGMLAGVKKDPATFVWAASGIDFGGNMISRRGTLTLIR